MLMFAVHNLRVKEVVIDDRTMRDRFVVCHSPDQADRDRGARGDGAEVGADHRQTPPSPNTTS